MIKVINMNVEEARVLFPYANSVVELGKEKVMIFLNNVVDSGKLIML